MFDVIKRLEKTSNVLKRGAKIWDNLTILNNVRSTNSWAIDTIESQLIDDYFHVWNQIENVITITITASRFNPFPKFVSTFINFYEFLRALKNLLKLLDSKKICQPPLPDIHEHSLNSKWNVSQFRTRVYIYALSLTRFIMIGICIPFLSLTAKRSYLYERTYNTPLYVVFRINTYIKRDT